jgi:spore maturation protein CgeB
LKQAFDYAGIRAYLVYHGFDKTILPRLKDASQVKRENLVFSGSLITGGSFHSYRISLIEDIIKEKVGLALYVTLEKAYRIKAKQLIYSINSLSKNLKMESFTGRFPIFEYGRTPVKNYSKELLRAYHPPLYGIDMYNLFNIADIVLNIHAGVAADYAGNMRLFEVTGIGSCLLTDSKKNMNDLFDTDQEVIVYDSPDDCIAKIKWLLEKEDERKKIAQSGQKKTLEFHTVENRCKSIIDLINAEL